MTKPSRPYLVMGPDIGGATVYYRCRTLKGARWMSRGMEKWWTIVRVVHVASGAPNLMAEADKRDRPSNAAPPRPRA